MKKTQAEFLAAYDKALDRVERLRDEIRDRQDYADSDEIAEMSDAWNDAREDLQNAREDLESGGLTMETRPRRQTRRRAAARGAGR